MLHLLKMIVVAIAGAWSVLRATEEGLAAWVRRASRQRDLTGLAWA
jgi:hypothetical protein